MGSPAKYVDYSDYSLSSSPLDLACNAAGCAALAVNMALDSDPVVLLSGRPGGTPFVPVADGGDAPGFSRHRPGYDPPADLVRAASGVPYAELHCHSNFSFLDGASAPEEASLS